MAGHGRTFRTRGHGPGVTNQACTARAKVRTAPSGHDLSTAVTAVVMAAAAPPGSRPGAPGAAPTRSSARWRVNGEPGLRGEERCGGGGTTRAGGRIKQNERDHLHLTCVRCGANCFCQNSVVPDRDNRYFWFAPSATNIMMEWKHLTWYSPFSLNRSPYV